MCCVCRRKKPKSQLLRMTAEEVLTPDLTGKAGGRGIYVCRDAGCISRLMHAKRWRRRISPSLGPELLRQLGAEGKPDE